MSDLDNVDILLIEDNPFDAEMTLRAFKKSNISHRIHWVKDGVEALEFINATGAYEARSKSNLPKLILLDLKMPRLGGFDVLRAFKGEERTRPLPIVVMTSSNQENDVAEAYRLGANAYVTKPVQYPDFVAAVNGIGLFWLSVNRVP